MEELEKQIEKTYKVNKTLGDNFFLSLRISSSVNVTAVLSVSSATVSDQTEVI